MINKNYSSSIILLCAVISLTACGIKPNELDPPSVDKTDTFPKTYPTSK